jgi:tetratricopeptide (TPR) repeat protein
MIRMKLNKKLFKAIFISLSLLFIPIESNAQSSAKSDQKIKYKKARALQSSTAKRMAKVYEALERIDEETGKEDPDYETAKELLGDLRDDAQNLRSYDRSVVWNSWGYMYIVDEEVDLAIDAYTKLINEPEVTLGLRNAGLLTLAQLYMANEEFQKSVDFLLEWMTQVEKVTAQSWSILATAYYQLGDFDKALLNMEKAITLAEEEGYKPKENWYIVIVASVEELKNKIGPKKAMLKQVDIYEILVNLYPKKSYFVRLGQTYGQLDREKDFMVTLNSAYLKDLLDKETEYVTLAQLLLLNQNPYQAAKVLEAGRIKKVIRVDDETKEESLVSVVKDSEKNLRLLADSWRMSQEIDKAIPILEKAAKMSKEGKNYVLLGNLYLAEDKLELAIDSIKKGLKKGKISKVSQVHLTLGQAYFELQQFDEAKKQFGIAARDKDKKVIATANNWIRYTENEEVRVKNLALRREFIKNS